MAENSSSNKLVLDKIVGLNNSNKIFLKVKKDPYKELLKKVSPPDPTERR